MMLVGAAVFLRSEILFPESRILKQFKQREWRNPSRTRFLVRSVTSVAEAQVFEAEAVGFRQPRVAAQPKPLPVGQAHSMSQARSVSEAGSKPQARVLPFAQARFVAQSHPKSSAGSSVRQRVAFRTEPLTDAWTNPFASVWKRSTKFLVATFIGQFLCWLTL